MSIQLMVNGQVHLVEDRHATTPLLWVLRDVLGIHGVKFGCGAGWCAACTVLLDGKNVKACQTPLSQVGTQRITTVEGVSGSVSEAVRAAWYQGNVLQCGYCQPGQTLAAMALLSTNPDPDDEAINRAMSGNLCRCGTYPRIRQAIHTAATTLREQKSIPPLPIQSLETADHLPRGVTGQLSPYIHILPDNRVEVLCTQVELGQGVHTSVATIVAEELDVSLTAIRIVDIANNTSLYGNPVFGNLLQVVGDSTSTRGFWIRYRKEAAAVRARLVEAAARLWTVSSQEIVITDGVLRHGQSHQATFAELLEEAQHIAPPEEARPKDPALYRLIGSERILRVDTPAKLVGAAQYTIDTVWPGMRTAVVLHPPRFGATVRTLEDRAARTVPGVVAVVPISHGVAVIAETFFDAVKGMQALSVDWDDTAAELRGSDELLAEHHRLLETGEGVVTARHDGDVDQAFRQAAHTVEGTYEFPYLAHAPMEPDNAACRMRKDGVVEVWAGTQAPDYARSVAARAAGLPEECIEIHVTLAGGGFGLRGSGEAAPVAEVVEIASSLGWIYPLKLQWPRQEEFKVFRGRPLSVHRARVALDETGKLTAYDHRQIVQSVIADMPVVNKVLIHDGFDEKSVQGALDQPYSIGNVRIEVGPIATGIPVGTWRSTGSAHNEFVRETLLDEGASAAGRDPVDVRKALLADNPRLRAVLETTARLAGWGTPLENAARGIAVSNGFKSLSALVIQVSHDSRGRLRVDRMVAAVDCGIAINPDLVRAQMEGGILFGLSAAFWGNITFSGGMIDQQMFDSYPLLRMRTTPPIEVHVIPSQEEPGGIGEVGVPLTAPALANAIAALTGTRIRVLPITKTVKVPM